MAEGTAFMNGVGIPYFSSCVCVCDACQMLCMSYYTHVY